MSDLKYLTVSALTKYIKRKFDADPHLQDVLLKGEISNFKAHSRGHFYFTLKDDQSRIKAVMFSSQNQSLLFQPEEGMKVLIRGSITVYESTGEYQIYVKEMDPDGIGSLFAAYEQLKKKLELEGLFSSEYKKPLPKYPRKIGVITSPTGAAVRDILTTLQRRFPIAEVVILPVLVQGVNASKSIVQAIETANDIGDFDVLIAGRGGGSIEELWAFNEEIVARAIFHSSIPIVSAVGHETDFTIADFVADLRAATPTGAAELVVPNMVDILAQLQQRKIRLNRAINERVKAEKERLDKVKQSVVLRFPQRLYQQKEMQLDFLLEKLQKQTKQVIRSKQEALQLAEMRLNKKDPQDIVQRNQLVLLQLTQNLKKDFQNLYDKKSSKFQSITQHLDAVSPLKIMNKGYSLLYDEDNNLIKSVDQTEIGQNIVVRMNNGKLTCLIEGREGFTEHGK